MPGGAGLRPALATSAWTNARSTGATSQTNHGSLVASPVKCTTRAFFGGSVLKCLISAADESPQPASARASIATAAGFHPLPIALPPPVGGPVRGLLVESTFQD